MENVTWMIQPSDNFKICLKSWKSDWDGEKWMLTDCSDDSGTEYLWILCQYGTEKSQQQGKTENKINLL